MHLVEGANTSTQFSFLANFPSHKQWTRKINDFWILSFLIILSNLLLIIGEKRDPGRLHLGQMAVQDIEAVVAHFRLDCKLQKISIGNTIRICILNIFFCALKIPLFLCSLEKSDRV